MLGKNDIHIVPVRLRPSTITFIGRVRTDGSVSTRRGFGDAMIALAELDTVVEVLVTPFGRQIEWWFGVWVKMKWRYPRREETF